jgi:hypothetical protein
MPLQLRDKSNFVPQLTPATNTFKSNLSTPVLLSSQYAGILTQIQTLDLLARSSDFPMAAQNQDVQVNSPSVSFIRHLDFRFYLKSLFRSSSGAFH